MTPPMTKRDREELNWWNAMAVTALVFKYGSVWLLDVDYPTSNSVWIIISSMFILNRQWTLFFREGAENDR